MAQRWSQDQISATIQALAALLEAADLCSSDADQVVDIVLPALLTQSGAQPEAFSAAARRVLDEISARPRPH